MYIGVANMAKYLIGPDTTINNIQEDALQIFGKYDLDKSLIWMTEEFGEVFQAIRKGKNKDDITGEIGDLITWIFCIANILDISLEEAINSTFTKELNRQLATYGHLKYCILQKSDTILDVFHNSNIQHSDGLSFESKSDSK